MEVELKRSPSFVWRSLWSSLGLLKEGMVWRVGNRKNIRIWKDKWLPKPKTFQVQTYTNTLDSECLVEALIDEESRAWRVDLVQAVFNEEEAKIIVSISFSKTGANDKRIWAGSSKGNFFVKSAYFMETKLLLRNLGDSSSGRGNEGMWRALWQLDVSDKVKIETETTLHILWTCPAAAYVWGAPGGGCENSKFRKWNSSFSDFQHLWEEMVGILKLAALFCYHIWGRRNAFVFQDQFINPTTIIVMAQADLSILKEIKQKNSIRPDGGPNSASSNQQWQPPTWPFIKVNFDAAYDKDSNRMGMGIIVRDSEGGLQACLPAPREQIFSVFQAERAILHRALELCVELGMNQVIFEGDVKVVIDAINSKCEDNSWLGQEIEDIQQLMELHPTWRLSFVYRSTNNTAHTAVKVAIKEFEETVWLEDGPEVVITSILNDVSCIPQS
ncbi:hypothetical protein CIPAW_15G035300 [Carya illinoinensis]|uniref:RNase H type-1 domain-containing protein n=1 Tax=Carya illinoinensis TaxID=32201 RepID=A0A8T1NB19_CARIL|nr:hypothetical protein CIPAW_15G035300 [Carya illinoinensis]